jgi:hypothetical protein
MHSSVIIVAMLVLLQVVQPRPLQLRGHRFIDLGLLSYERPLRHRKPMDDLPRKLLELDPAVGGPIDVDFPESLCQLARCPLKVLIEKMVESDRDLYQSLQEEPVTAPRFVPEIFQRIMALEEESAVKFFDTAQKLPIVHMREYTKKIGGFPTETGQIGWWVNFDSRTEQTQAEACAYQTRGIGRRDLQVAYRIASETQSVPLRY